ncbi:ABC transporter substrate-binding protein [Bauldia sp.]|uniref:ABC transporter substrate-binding protein n=1 Tax=Bauldia sp. TaxID=2575872 RepID=UPI003BAB7F4F
MWKKLTTLAAATFLSAGAAMAQPPSDVEANLKIVQWVNDQIIASTNSAIERFAEKYPNVTIETQYVPVTGGAWGEYINAFLNQMAAGDTPDIVAVAIEGFAEIASKGVVIDLEELTAADPHAAEVMEGIEANLLDGMRTRPTGELNFFPTEWNNIVMYYNKDMFDEAGIAYPEADWTWDDFLETAKALTKTDADGNVTQFGYVVSGAHFSLQPWLFTNNASILDENWREPTVTTPEFRESLQFLHDLINVHRVAPTHEGGHGTEKFVASQAAMVAAGHWPVPEMMEAGLENVGVQHMPQNKRQATVFGIGGLAITMDSPNKELAWEFIKEMTGDEYQQELADSMRSIPSARAQATDPEWTAWPDNSEIFYETAATAIAVPSPPNFAEVQEIFQRHLNAYMNEDQDLDTTISQMDRELQRSMSRAY